MSVEVSPLYQQAGSVSAEQLRRGTTDGMLSRNGSWAIGTTSGGVFPASGELAVAAPGSGLSVNVAAGVCWVPGSASFATTPGGYYLRNTATLNVTGFVANATNPTIYAVVATINDAAYHGATNNGVIQAISGTPSSGATLTNLTGAPAIPDASLLLAWVLVPANATNIITADILNWYQLGKNAVNQYPGDVPAVAHHGLPQCGPLVDASGSADTLKPFTHRGCASGSPTYTLPVPFPGCTVKVTNYGSGVVTVQHNASEVVFGLGMTTSGVGSFLLGVPGASATLECLDGTNWFVTAGMQDSGPINPSLVNSWAAVSGFPTSYRLQGNRVYFELGVQTGTPGTSVFTLPAGYRPLSEWQFTGSSNGPDSLVAVQVTTAGVVTLFATAVVGGATSYFCVASFGVDG